MNHCSMLSNGESPLTFGRCIKQYSWDSSKGSSVSRIKKHHKFNEKKTQQNFFLMKNYHTVINSIKRKRTLKPMKVEAEREDHNHKHGSKLLFFCNIN